MTIVTGLLLNLTKQRPYHLIRRRSRWMVLGRKRVVFDRSRAMKPRDDC